MNSTVGTIARTPGTRSRRLPTRIAQLVYVFLFALVAGVFWGTWFGLARSMNSLTPETFLEVGKAFIANLGGPMSILLPVTLLSGLLVLIALFRQREMAAFYLAMTSLLLLIGVLVVTLVVNVPIDGEIEVWTIATLPRDWEQTRDRWDLYHTIRTFGSLLGLALALVSVIAVSAAPSSQRDASRRGLDL